MLPIRIIIAGSRSFNDYKFLKEKVDGIISSIPRKEVVVRGIEIVSGGARGADSLGEKYARERGYWIRQFPAKWSLFGRSAGYKRNLEMGKYANSLILFWLDNSKGSRNMYEVMLQLDKPCTIFKL
jgi:hypothetical protein